MKTPLILLATTLLIAGCSTASNQIDNYSTESQQSDSLIQSKEQLLNYVKEVEATLANIKEVIYKSRQIASAFCLLPLPEKKTEQCVSAPKGPLPPGL